MERKAEINRKSNETQIIGFLNVDGTGQTKIKTPIGLLSHMLELFAFHGHFDLEIEVKGDTHIDIHHTNEDIAIALGKAFKKALGEEKFGIKRFGYAYAPMEATIGRCVIDISGRGYFSFNTFNSSAANPQVSQILAKERMHVNKEDYELSYFEHFMESFALQMGATLNFTLQTPSNDLHTNLETMFKSLGLALDQATTVDPRRVGKVPSTKGIID